MNSATGPPLPKICTKTIKNVYKNYAKQLICIYSIYKDCTNLNFVLYWIYKKCTSNSYIYIYIYTTNVQTIQNLYKVQIKNGLRLEMYVYCIYKQCTNYTKLIQLANWNSFCMLFVHTNNVQTIQNIQNLYN